MCEGPKNIQTLFQNNELEFQLNKREKQKESSNEERTTIYKPDLQAHKLIKEINKKISGQYLTL